MWAKYDAAVAKRRAAAEREHAAAECRAAADREQAAAERRAAAYLAAADREQAVAKRRAAAERERAAAERRSASGRRHFDQAQSASCTRLVTCPPSLQAAASGQLSLRMHMQPGWLPGWVQGCWAIGRVECRPTMQPPLWVDRHVLWPPLRVKANGTVHRLVQPLAN